MYLKVLVILGCGVMSLAHAKSDVRFDRAKGIYFQSDLGYEADPITELCFKGTSEIPCHKLAKRAEWAKVITWEMAAQVTDQKMQS
jgi:hypothetical protein